MRMTEMEKRGWQKAAVHWRRICIWQTRNQNRNRLEMAGAQHRFNRNTQSDKNTRNKGPLEAAVLITPHHMFSSTDIDFGLRLIALISTFSIKISDRSISVFVGFPALFHSSFSLYSSAEYCSYLIVDKAGVV